MKFLRLIFTAIFISVSVFGVIISSKKLQSDLVLIERKSEVKILNLYHVDTFPGGTGSRQQFLLKVAYGFEKINSGILVNVVNLTVDGYKDRIDKGKVPDMVSFGVGVKVENQVCFDANLTFPSGNINGKTFSIPWARGGYFIFDKNIKSEGTLPTVYDNLIISLSNYTSPFTPLVLSDIKANTFSLLEDKLAYVEFLQKDNAVLVGTQRDLFRLYKSGVEFGIIPLKLYSDLYQYICITSTDKANVELSVAFINYLVSEDVQKKLTSIAMFSPYFDNVYLEDYYHLAETAFPDTTLYVNIGDDYAIFKDLSQKAFIMGGQDKFKIKNSLISLEKFH
ncbi:MAG: hypothetical protein J6B16_01230 [Clostridia bacterium]|nr:hypothetical protein [Clostridia bacterium]